jgi:hypothetical protein
MSLGAEELSGELRESLEMAVELLKREGKKAIRQCKDLMCVVVTVRLL